MSLAGLPYAHSAGERQATESSRYELGALKWCPSKLITAKAIAKISGLVVERSALGSV